MQSKITSGIMTGRPFGGTAVLIRQQLGTFCHQIVTDNPRITCICVPNQYGPNLIVCSIYVPWSDRSVEHVTEYEACLGCIQGIIDRHRGAQFLFGGDFNVSKHSNNICSLYVKQFVECNNMLWLDVRDGECDYTYHNDANSHYSLLDYFIVSTSLVNECKAVGVLDDGDNPSDHLAVSCRVNVATEMAEPSGMRPSTFKDVKLDWNNANISAYANKVTELLTSVSVPTDALLCHGSCSCTIDHTARLESYYGDIKWCLHTAASSFVPSIKMGIQKHWWSPELNELKLQCIDAIDLWKSAGRPRSGDVNKNRIRCKLKYKNAIKEAAANADNTFNDRLYEKLCTKNNVAFWKAWRKRFCSHNQKPANIVNGCSGDDNIRREFSNYFSSIVSPNSVATDDFYKSKIEAFSLQPEEYVPVVDMKLIQICVAEMKNNKTPGFDSIYSEHIKYGGVQLLVHLCLLFNE